MTAGRRNVVLVTLDQWRGDCVGEWGHPTVRTPSVDRLVRDSVSFVAHHAVTAPCGPSRASLYTGLYAMNHRSVLNGTPLDDRHANVARLARELGYAPALFGYTDASVDPRTVAADDPRLTTYEGVLDGFDAVLDLPSEHPVPWLEHLASVGVDVDLASAASAYEPAAVDIPDGRGATWPPARYRAEHSEAAFLTDRLLAWLADRAADDGPGFFVHASYLRPHPPYLAPAPWHDAFDPGALGPFRGAPTREEEAAVHPLAAVAVGLPGVGAPADERDRRQLRATYYGMLGEVDAQLGRLLDGLDELGLRSSTLVVLTSDHGEMGCDHWLTEKLGWWDESYHVPLIVRDPDAPPDAAGRRVESVTEHVDVVPTILDWLGAPTPVACDGRSLAPFVSGSGAPPDRWRTAAHWEWDFRDPVGHLAEDAFGITMEECSLTVLRGARWKYVHFTAESLPDLLFDLEHDPDGIHDLAADPAYAAQLASCASAMLSWRTRHLDRTLTGAVLGPGGPTVRVDPRVG